MTTFCDDCGQDWTDHTKTWQPGTDWPAPEWVCPDGGVPWGFYAQLEDTA